MNGCDFMERLQKVIAQSGVTSRRKAEELMKQGKVSVDGVIITELGFKVKSGAQIIVEGKQINKESKVYYVMNKPKKSLCTLNDEHSRLTVIDVIGVKERVFPVGRLDYEIGRASCRERVCLYV